MKIKKILFATKFDDVNLETIKSLLCLTQAGLEEIILTHIIPRDEVAFVPFRGYLKDEEKRLREEARIRFDDWRDDIGQAGAGAKIAIEVGDPVPEIMKIAETEKVDLIVSGITRRSGLEKVYAGSHTLELLRRSTSIPVLVFKGAVTRCDDERIPHLHEHPFQRPLFAADWSKPSERALEFLTALGKVIQKVDMAHVLKLEASKDDDNTEWKRIEAESRDRLNQYCSALREAGIVSEPHLAAGPAASEILRLCEELDSTLMVLGTSGKDRLHTFFLGSLSQRIAEESDLPTLLTP